MRMESHMAGESTTGPMELTMRGTSKMVSGKEKAHGSAKTEMSTKGTSVQTAKTGKESSNGPTATFM